MLTLTFTEEVSTGRDCHVISPALLLVEGWTLTAHVAPAQVTLHRAPPRLRHSHTAVNVLSTPPFKAKHDASVTLEKTMDK